MWSKTVENHQIWSKTVIQFLTIFYHVRWFIFNAFQQFFIFIFIFRKWPLSTNGQKLPYIFYNFDHVWWFSTIWTIFNAFRHFLFPENALFFFNQNFRECNDFRQFLMTFDNFQQISGWLQNFEKKFNLCIICFRTNPMSLVNNFKAYL